MDDKKRYSKQELDDFWSIESIVPRRSSKPPQSAKRTETVEITVGSALEGINESPAFSAQKLSFSDGELHRDITPDYSTMLENKSTLEFEYFPEKSLIKSVKVFKWRTAYNYYDDFLADARKLISEELSFAEHIPYFSYVPQYSQLSQAQLDYYIYFRSEARQGRYIDADYSYILLYIYEIINLADELDTVSGQSILCGLWKAYRHKHFKLAKQLIEWICDYSLMNRLPPPRELALGDVAALCSLKEFFVVISEGDRRAYADTLLAFSSSYDYHTSKFAEGDMLKLFDELVPEALAECIRYTSSGAKSISDAFGDTHLPRDAFSGALCSHKIKRKIDVEYCSFSKINEFRYWVGDIVKYSENKIRAYSGIKSRLSCYSIQSDIKTLLDGFFKERLPLRRKRAAKEKKAEYDYLYDLPKKELSIGDAKRIEEESWETTQSLVDTFETEESEYSSTVLSVPEEDLNDFSNFTLMAENEETGLIEALGELLPFVLSAMAEDSAKQREIARLLGKMPDSLADTVNEISADIIGDILLEENDGKYSVIEDYRNYFENLES